MLGDSLPWRKEGFKWAVFRGASSQGKRARGPQRPCNWLLWYDPVLRWRTAVAMAPFRNDLDAAGITPRARYERELLEREGAMWMEAGEGCKSGDGEKGMSNKKSLMVLCDKTGG